MQNVIVKQQDSWFRPLFIEGKELTNIVIFNENTQVEIGRGFIEQAKRKDLEQFTLSELQNKRSVDFSRKNHFLMKSELYIYSPVITAAEFLKHENARHKTFYNLITFTIDNLQVQIEKWSRNENTTLGEFIDEIDKANKRRRINLQTYDLEEFLKYYEIKPKKRPDFCKFEKILTSFDYKEFEERENKFLSDKRINYDNRRYVELRIEQNCLTSEIYDLIYINAGTPWKKEEIFKYSNVKYNEVLQALKSKLKDLKANEKATNN
jgi:hypothetical protein